MYFSTANTSVIYNFMSRLLLTTIFIFCGCSLFAQTYPGYDYVYEIKTKPKFDTGYCLINAKRTTNELINISGGFVDKFQNPRSFVIIKLSTSDTTFTTQSDALGNFDVELPYNVYSFSITGNLNICFGDNQLIQQVLNQKFIYGCKSYPDKYKIRSKHKLSQTKINKIRRCVEVNLTPLAPDCNSKDKYFIDTLR